MALISAGEWIDRYGADAERRAVRGDADEPEQPLSFHILADVAPPQRAAGRRGRRWRRLSRMPRLRGSFHPAGARPLRRFVRRHG